MSRTPGPAAGHATTAAAAGPFLDDLPSSSTSSSSTCADHRYRPTESAAAPVDGAGREPTGPSRAYVLLLGAAVGVSAWAYQIYGRGPAHSEHLFHQVLFWAELPAIVVALLTTAPGTRPALRATLPSLVVVGVITLLPGHPDGRRPLWSARSSPWPRARTAGCSSVVSPP